MMKQFDNRVHSSTKVTPKQGSLKNNEGFVYQTLSDKRTKMKAKFLVNDLVQFAGLRRSFSKGDTTIWYYNLNKITEVKNNTIPGYHLDNLQERYNEALLKTTQFTMRKKTIVG